MVDHEIKVISGPTFGQFSKLIADRLGTNLTDATVETFPDGEVRVKINEDVRGADAFIIQSTCPPVNDNLMALMIIIDCLRRASASRITAVIPYFGYARQDRKDEGRVPITAKLIANMLTGAGANRVMTMDLHAEQIQGFFDIPVDHLYASKVFIDYLRTKNLKSPVVLAPDVGSSKRALAYARRLGDGVEIAIVEKRRMSATSTSVGYLIGNVKDRDVIIPDDMISTGSSIVKAAEAAKEQGCKRIFLAATHAVLVPPGSERLQNSQADEVLVTDTIPVPDSKKFDKLRILSVAPLMGDAIGNIHNNRSVSSLIN